MPCQFCVQDAQKLVRKGLKRFLPEPGAQNVPVEYLRDGVLRVFYCCEKHIGEVEMMLLKGGNKLVQPQE